MRLFYVPGACSLASHIVAREAGLDIVLDKVEFGRERRTQSGRDYYAINPQGSVPALELDSGEVLTENAVVMQYLAAQDAQNNLAPAEGMTHWRLLETLNFIATELHKGFSHSSASRAKTHAQASSRTSRAGLSCWSASLPTSPFCSASVSQSPTPTPSSSSPGRGNSNCR